MRETANHIRTLCLLLLACGIASACNLQRVTPTPLPTPDRPRIEILRPAPNQQVIEDSAFDIDILALDPGRGIQRIELYVDDMFLKASEVPDALGEYRVTMNWYAQGLGWHAIKAIAYRDDGTRSEAFVINLQVIPRS